MESKRYTAQEMRVMAGSIDYNRSVTYYPDVHKIALMLRQAADASEELAQLKARLEAVAKECEKSRWDSDNWLADAGDAACVHNRYVDRIIRAARGEGGAV